MLRNANQENFNSTAPKTRDSDKKIFLALLASSARRLSHLGNVIFTEYSLGISLR